MSHGPDRALGRRSAALSIDLEIEPLSRFEIAFWKRHVTICPTSSRPVLAEKANGA